MPETTTVTHNEGEDPSVLAQAAVASAAVAGASAAKSDAAQDDASEARRIAEEAQASANAAASMAAQQPTSLSEDDARRIAREEFGSALNEFLATRQTSSTPVTVEVDPQAQPPAPKSVQKANGEDGGKKKQGSWARKWLGE